MSIESRIAAPGTKMAFAERKGELWRKNQPLVTQNSVSPSRLAVYPNGRPRTRLPSRRHARPAVKRYVVEADMFEKIRRERTDRRKYWLTGRFSSKRMPAAPMLAGNI
eukprot:jgi/Undpi1/11895/HiC_scaffold_4.g01594.m1